MVLRPHTFFSGGKTMVNFVSTPPKILTSFLDKFHDVFTRPAFLSFSVYLNGLFLELKRTNIQTIASRNFFANYENLQYFISEAKWDEEKLNNHRIQILESNRTTKTCKKGVLVIDDTGCKKWGFKTEGAQVQHYGTEDVITNCNIVVASAYCDNRKRFPINLKPYIPENDSFFEKNFESFKSKIELAQELMQDAIDKKLNFSDFIFDTWYFSNDTIEFIQEKGRTFITEAPVDRLISYRGKWTRAGDLVKVIPSDKLRWVTVTTPHGKKKSFYTYCFKSKLKGLKGKFGIVVAIGQWDKDDQKNVHIYVTNHLSYSAEDTLKKYALRWGIECIFRDLKENVAFDHYQVRSIKAINRHWHLASLAFTFLMISKLNGTFSKIFRQKPKTVGKQLEMFRKLNSLSATNWIMQNLKLYQQSCLGTNISLPRSN